MQKILNPSLEQKVADGRNFDVYLKPEQPVTLQNLKDIMRNHFEGYAHDPYSFGLNGSEPWRPISVFRTYEAHILQVRPWMPREIGDVIYVAFRYGLPFLLHAFLPRFRIRFLLRSAKELIMQTTSLSIGSSVSSKRLL